MERILFDLGILLIMILLCVWKAEKTQQAYKKLKEDNEKLKDNYRDLLNEVKLLRQENFYLKEMTNTD